MKPPVLCIPTPVFRECSGDLQGFRACRSGDLRLLEYSRWVPREDAEKDPSYKQIIPYIIVPRRRLHVLGQDFLCYTRGSGGAETRLHGRVSIGLGGHVDNKDANGIDHDPLRIIQRAAMRELREELSSLPYSPSLRIAGIVNEDQTEVGTVHFGVVMVLRYEGFWMGHEPSTSELDTITGLSFASRDTLRAYMSNGSLELWSSYCVQNLDKIFPAA